MTSPDNPKSPPSLRAVRTEAKCPVCGRSIGARYRPFCSKRCADVDLGRWFKEGYRVPTDEIPAESEGPDDGSGVGGPTAGQRR